MKTLFNSRTWMIGFVAFAATISLSLNSFADDTHGLFMVVKGDVKITAGKDGKTETAKVGRKVFSGDTIEAGKDARAKIVMSDKNVLNISPDSKLTIEKYVNNKNEKNVELKVDYGKVRASVEQKYDGEKSKFQIKTPSAVAGVRGTDFLTSFDRKTRVSQVITFSGLVAVGTPSASGKIENPVFVRPGEMTQAGEGKKPETPKAVPQEQLKQVEQETVSDSARKEPEAKDNTAAKKEEVKEEKKEDKKDADKGEAKAPAAGDKAEKKEEPKKDAAAPTAAKDTKDSSKSADSSAGAAAPRAPAAAAPSMMDPAKDGGVNPNLMPAMPSSSPAAYIPSAPTYTPPPRDYTDYIKNQTSKTTIIIRGPQ